jgi:flagellar FliL protein
MAKDEKSVEEEAPAPKPKKKKLLIIIIVLVVVLALLGAGAFFMLSGGKSKKHGEDDAKDEKSANTVVVAFEEKFTVNLQAEDGSMHYLQVPKVELEVGSDKVAKEIEEHKSKISDRISSVLRSRTMKDMQQPGSDLKLKDDLKKIINETLELKGSERGKGVKEVILPASFIVQ